MGWSCALKGGSNSSVTIQASLLRGGGSGRGVGVSTTCSAVSVRVDVKLELVKRVCPLLAVPLL